MPTVLQIHRFQVRSALRLELFPGIYVAYTSTQRISCIL